MRFSAYTALAAILLLAPVAAKSQVPITGPILGYVWDPAAAGIRPILGIPGSSTLGPTLDVGVTLRSAQVSPRQDYALALPTEPGRFVIVDLPAGRVSAALADGATPDHVTLSPTGASALLYYHDRRSVRVITGLPAAPSAAGEFDLSGLPAPVTAMAINDPGDTVLVAVSPGLYALTAGREPLLVSAAGQISAISFFGNSHHALFADYSHNEVVWMRDVAGAAERIVLAGENDGIAKPISVAAFSDDRRVLVASAASAAMLDLAGGPPALVTCQCNISGLYRLKGESLFRLNAPSRDPMFLLDAGAAEPRILFIPSLAKEGPGISTAVQTPRGRRRE